MIKNQNKVWLQNKIKKYKTNFKTVSLVICYILLSSTLFLLLIFGAKFASVLFKSPFASLAILKGIVHQFLLLFKSYILDSSGVWYS